MSGGRRSSRGEDFGDTANYYSSGERRSRRRDRREYAEEPKKEKNFKVDPTMIMIIVTVVIVIVGFITLFVMGLKNGKKPEDTATNERNILNDFQVIQEDKVETLKKYL